jgi:hypothetical protein
MKGHFKKQEIAQPGSQFSNPEKEENAICYVTRDER